MTKVTIVETQPIFAAGIQKILGEQMGLHLILANCSGRELLYLLQTEQPDLLLMDAQIDSAIEPDELIRLVKNLSFRLKIILFGKDETTRHLNKLRKVGLDGYLLKNVVTTELLQAVSVVLSGNGYLQESVRQNLNFFELPVTQTRINAKLTKRELQILSLIIEENTTQEIADQLYISLPTVETHRKNLIQKMGVKNTAGLVREAIAGKWYGNDVLRNWHHGKPV